MNNKFPTGLAIVVAFVALIAIVGLLWMTTSNAEIRYRNEFNAQVKANESEFDKVWKVIAQQVQVSQQERETFKKTYVEIMQSQQGIAGKGALASFFQQAQVPVSAELFSKLMTTLEAQRESFNRSQKKLVQIKLQHDNILQTFPGSIVVGGRPPLELVLVSSDKTKEIFSTGTDNDVELFQTK